MPQAPFQRAGTSSQLLELTYRQATHGPFAARRVQVWQRRDQETTHDNP